MDNNLHTDSGIKIEIKKTAKISSVMSLIQEMGIVISNTDYVWTNEMRTAFNKAVKRLGKQDISITS